jgi:hypothetical protein
MENNPEPGSGINIPDLIPVPYLITWHRFFGFKLKLFDAYPDPGSYQPGIRDGKNLFRDPGSGINIPYPQHCV